MSQTPPPPTPPAGPQNPWAQPAPAGPPQKNWFGRNWKWFVPVVVVVVLAPCLVCGGVIGGGWFAINKALKSSGAYTQSLPMVQNHPEVRAALGTPIEAGGVSGGSINTQAGGSGDATVNYSVKGPNGSADVTAVGVKRAGNWTLTELTVDTGAKTIQILPAPGGGQPPAGIGTTP